METLICSWSLPMVAEEHEAIGTHVLDELDGCLSYSTSCDFAPSYGDVTNPNGASSGPLWIKSQVKRRKVALEGVLNSPPSSFIMSEKEVRVADELFLPKEGAPLYSGSSFVTFAFERPSSSCLFDTTVHSYVVGVLHCIHAHLLLCRRVDDAGCLIHSFAC